MQPPPVAVVQQGAVGVQHYICIPEHLGSGRPEPVFALLPQSDRWRHGIPRTFGFSILWGLRGFGFNHDLAHRGPSATARLALGHSDRHRPLRLAFSSVTWGRARLAHDEARPAAVEREKHSVRQVFDMARPAFAERVDVRYRKQILEWNELAALD
jgi:hypothetical protein